MSRPTVPVPPPSDPVGPPLPPAQGRAELFHALAWALLVLVAGGGTFAWFGALLDSTSCSETAVAAAAGELRWKTAAVWSALTASAVLGAVTAHRDRVLPWSVFVGVCAVFGVWATVTVQPMRYCF